jgi:hypothetical protein
MLFYKALFTSLNIKNKKNILFKDSYVYKDKFNDCMYATNYTYLKNCTKDLLT